MKSKEPRVAVVVSSETSSIKEISQKLGRSPDAAYIKNTATDTSWPAVHPFNIAVFRFDGQSEGLDAQFERLGHFLYNSSAALSDLRNSCAIELHLEYSTRKEGGFMLRHEHLSKIAFAQLDLLVSINWSESK